MNERPQDDVINALLYVAAPHAGQQELEEYRSADPTLKLTHRAKRRIAKRAKGGPAPVVVYTKRAAIVALVAISLCFAAVLSISAVREAIWDALVSWYEKSIAVSFVSKAQTIVPTEILEYREPRAIEEEFERYEISKTGKGIHIEYEYGEILIIYRQGLLRGFEIQTTNEETMVSNITINGNKGVLTISKPTDIEYATIIWNDGVYSYKIDGTFHGKNC